MQVRISVIFTIALTLSFLALGVGCSRQESSLQSRTKTSESDQGKVPEKQTEVVEKFIVVEQRGTPEDPEIEKGDGVDTKDSLDPSTDQTSKNPTDQLESGNLSSDPGGVAKIQDSENTQVDTSLPPGEPADSSEEPDPSADPEPAPNPLTVTLQPLELVEPAAASRQVIFNATGENGASDGLPCQDHIVASSNNQSLISNSSLTISGTLPDCRVDYTVDAQPTHLNQEIELKMDFSFRDFVKSATLTIKVSQLELLTLPKMDQHLSYDHTNRQFTLSGLKTSIPISFALLENGLPISMNCSSNDDFLTLSQNLFLPTGMGHATAKNSEASCVGVDGPIGIRVQSLPHRTWTPINIINSDGNSGFEFHVSRTDISDDGNTIVMDVLGLTGYNFAVVAYRIDAQQLLYVSSYDGTPKTNANAYARNGRISGNGRYVVFESGATNLVDNGNLLNGNNQIYRKDLENMATPPDLVTATDGTPGTVANSSPQHARISYDGNKIVFHSNSTNLVAGITTGPSQVYLKTYGPSDTETINLVSSRDGSVGTRAASSVYSPNISNDGSTACFLTSASNLTVPSLTGTPYRQVLVKDLNNLATPAVLASSVDADPNNYGNGFHAECRLNNDGTKVIFDSGSTNLVAGMGSSTNQLYYKDLSNLANAPILVSSINGTPGTASVDPISGSTGFSADGRYVSFSGSGRSFGASTLYDSIYRKDILNIGLAPQVLSSTDFTATGAISKSAYLGAMSSDARYYVMVVSNHSVPLVNVQGGGPIRIPAIVDLNAPSTAPQRLDFFANRSPGVPNAGISESQISPDGRWLVFTSQADNLVPGTPIGVVQAFVQDRQNPADAPILISSPDGTGPNAADDHVTEVDISDDGIWVVYVTEATNLTGSLNHTSRKVLAKNRVTGTQVLVSSKDNTPATGALDDCREARISGDGRYVVFSCSSNLRTGYTHATHQIFRKSLESPSSEPELVSTANGLNSGIANDAAQLPVLSFDGRFVSFASAATNLVTGSTEQQIFVKDLNNQSLPPILASSTDGTVGNRSNGICPASEISADGTRVIFRCRGNSLAPGIFTTSVSNIFYKNLSTPLIAPKLVSTLDGTGVNSANQNGLDMDLDPSGRYVAFSTRASNLHPGATTVEKVYLWDEQKASHSLLFVSNPDLGNGLESHFSLADKPKVFKNGTRVIFHSLSTEILDTPLFDTGGIYEADVEGLLNP